MVKTVQMGGWASKDSRLLVASNRRGLDERLYRMLQGEVPGRQLRIETNYRTLYGPVKDEIYLLIDTMSSGKAASALIRLVRKLEPEEGARIAAYEAIAEGQRGRLTAVNALRILDQLRGSSEYESRPQEVKSDVEAIMNAVAETAGLGRSLAYISKEYG